MKTLSKVLLVDDDLATNFLHRMVIEEHGFAEEVVEACDGRDALEYLTTAVDGVYPKPDIIFLDINMPRMDGWEFLEAYADIAAECKAGAVIAMLTTSLNPDDRERAASFDCVQHYENKPLTVEKIDDLLRDTFPDCVRDA
ncbi:response regulator [Spongiibacter taiwanensis]|uniref:response regulator n=1 Tax=Spongiibacter taiwanensis TaxID=1748242 RepID=UPI002034D7CD|nr:response regulator [Spongiibacter taiwanensis]USA44367.1 response regulator [Spongiibacter taiwanensis]